MSSYPDFNLGLWQRRFSQGYIADRIGSFGWGSLDPVLIPFTFSEQYIRVSINADYKKDTWRQAAIIHQTIPTFLGNEDVISEHTLLLGKPEILDLIQYPDGYKLRVIPFNWFRDIDITVHEFINPNPSPDSPFILGL